MRYAGIGSRNTPNGTLNIMDRLGAFLAREGWILRSGGARGADSSFEAGCDSASGRKEIFFSQDAKVE